MQDQSDLDRKYFIDDTVYNCPFCNRRHVTYDITDWTTFHWSDEKFCYVYIVKCRSCAKLSMHLSYEMLLEKASYPGSYNKRFAVEDIDSKIFYSQPTSFFTIDERVPRIIRELITEAEGCLRMNYLTGASACTRKAIYELTIIEKAEGADYESKIKFLKGKYPSVDPSLFDILSHIQEMTSDKVHEQSWDKWDTSNLKLILEALKAVLYEMYVLPKEKEDRSLKIQELKEKVQQKQPAQKVPLRPPENKKTGK